ncbi:hypothetical protein C0W59_22080, partial [Photobacterium kishitanii]|uniref:helix-turn-helix domain-containing protein n=1 Tax=Photobacterium kishitanii TaxID=318456 RepID=UPI000D4F3E3D
GEVCIINCDKGFIFTSIKSTQQQMSYDGLFNVVCVIYSKSTFYWEQGSESGVLPFGGFILLNGKGPIKHENYSDDEIIVCFIPIIYLEKYVINNSKVVIGSNCCDYIIQLIDSMFFSDKNLTFKVQIVVNLLVLAIIENVDIKNGNIENREYKKLVEFIKSNALNNKINVDFVSRSIGMSKSKIHKLLKRNKTSYGQVVKDIRIAELAKKIECEYDKTVTQLSYECGFNSINHANVVFKTVKNMSISEYKKKLRLGLKYITE